MTERMQIAIEVMKSLLARDFKNIGYSSFSSAHKTAADYIVDQSFILANAMIARNKIEEEESATGLTGVVAGTLKLKNKNEYAK